GLARAGAPPISIDTRKAAVMEAALQVGAQLINDVSALTFDARSPAVAAKSGAPVILMHAQGTPKTMQAAPSYGDVVSDVAAFLRARMDAAEAAGVMRGQLIVDPGIGFGKTLAHNLALMNGLAAFKALGAPILFGASRKSFIEKLDPGAEPMERIGGSLAAALTAARAGATILRVHDVAETRQALRVQQAIAGAGCATGDAREQH
ncbi:MAG: dihydropteroate synthase, partial [Pseudomonadota bacterium]